MKKIFVLSILVLFSIFLISSCAMKAEPLNTKRKALTPRVEEKNTEKSGGAQVKSGEIEINGDIASTGMEEQVDSYFEGQNVKEVKVTLYFWDTEKNRLVSEVRPLLIVDESKLYKSVIRALASGPKSKTLKGVIPSGTKVISAELAENILTVNLSSDFLKAKDLLVARVALVNTLTELDAVRYVKIYVEGKELTSNGKEGGDVLGLLSKYSNDLDEVALAESKKDDIRKIDVDLYFTDIQSMYLIPEARSITVKNKAFARTIVEELIKGPAGTREGFYPTIPPEVQLLDIKLKKDKNKGDGVELYFSREFKTRFVGGSASEITLLGSLVYSLTSLPNVRWVKIYYQDESGKYIDEPIGNMDLAHPLKREDFGDILGKRIKVYFGDKDAKFLVPEYRAVKKDEANVAQKIIDELIWGPLYSNHIPVIPAGISKNGIKVWVEDNTAIVNLSSRLEGIKMQNGGEIMMLYAIVNSLTDPFNAVNVERVQFLVDGKIAESFFGERSLKDPFNRNPALIKEE